MGKAIVIIFVSVLIALYEIPKINKNFGKKELRVFLGLLSISTILTVLYIFEVNLPTPHDGIQLVFGPVSDWIFRLL